VLAKARPSDKLGLRVEFFGNSTAYISGVEADAATAAGRYNAAAAGHLQICPGMYIVAANGKTENSEISALLRSGETERVTLLVRRPDRIVASFEKHGLALGLMLKYDRCGDTLLVVQIDNSGSARFAGDNLRPGDRITHVNGKAGPVATLLAELKDAKKLELGVMRCPCAV